MTKLVYCPELHAGAVIDESDLVIDCMQCSDETKGRIRFWFGKITRDQFEALPDH
jgi:hypothetical protein